MEPKQLKPSIRGSWVQTERRAHEKWAALIREKPKAAELLHILVSQMDKRGAIVISQKVLAQLMNTSKDSVKRALVVLKDNNWIDVVRVGSERGGVNMYLVNRRVAWADKRTNQRYAAFDARVIVSADEQLEDDLRLDRPPLQKLPRLGEIQVPHGPGEEPPSQIFLEGTEPDLPSIPENE